MADGKLLAGIAIGGAAVGLPILGAMALSSAGYNKGRAGEELVWTGPFNIFGKTRDGTPVLVSSFKRGRRERDFYLRFRVITSELGELEKQEYITRRCLDEIKGEIEDLWERVSDIPELKEGLANLRAKLITTEKGIPMEVV